MTRYRDDSDDLGSMMNDELAPFATEFGLDAIIVIGLGIDRTNTWRIISVNRNGP